jgi:hypothetical protein
MARLPTMYQKQKVLAMNSENLLKSYVNEIKTVILFFVAKAQKNAGGG